MRAALGCSDRGHTAVSQLTAGRLRLAAIFGASRASRWFHTGGIFAALSDTTMTVAAEAMDAAEAAGTVVSYDLNYRESLWKAIGGKAKAQEVNRELVRKVDVLFGNEEDFSAMLGVKMEGVSESFDELPIASYEKMLRRTAAAYPNLKVIARPCARRTRPRECVGRDCAGGGEYRSCATAEVEILDRVGGGDSFASGLIYGLLAGKGSIGRWSAAWRTARWR